jgi:hypothetical protein
MNSKQKMKRFSLTAILFMALVWVAPVFADDSMDENSGDFITERTYIGVLATYASLDKNQDFDGTQEFVFYPSATTAEADGVPSLDNGYGFGVLLGQREGAYAGEFSYIQSYHTGTFTGPPALSPGTGENTAIYHVISLDFKRYFFTKLQAQPFVSLGVNYTWIDIDNASALVDFTTTPGTTVREGSLSLEGIGLNLGAGLEIYMGEGFSLVGGAYERFTGYSGITGIERQERTPESDAVSTYSLNSTGLNFVVGGTLAL